MTAIVFTPVVEHQQLLEEDTKPLIESGFCDSIVSFGDFIDLDLGRDLDREEDEEEDIPPLVDSGLTLAPLVQYSYAVPNIVDYIEQVETDNVSTICGMSRVSLCIQQFINFICNNYSCSFDSLMHALEPKFKWWNKVKI